jgi:type III pantothenate kinase
MFLALDIGNSNVVCAVYDSKKWIHSIRISSNLDFWNKFKTLKEYDITHASISSVVPKLTPGYVESIRNIFNIDAFIINHENSGIELNVEVPEEVGADRICNTAAAKKLAGCPAIIGDIGSATNYDVVNENGAFIGGAIAPGIEVAAQNLIQRAALLKKTAFIVPKTAVGKSTDSNLQSGIMLGAIDVIDGMFQRILTEMGWENSNVIITGGFGELISSHLTTQHMLIPTLTLDGIRIIYEKAS